MWLDRDPSGSIGSSCILIGALVGQQWGFLGSIEGVLCGFSGVMEGGFVDWGWSLWIKMTPFGPIRGLGRGSCGYTRGPFDFFKTQK